MNSLRVNESNSSIKLIMRVNGIKSCIKLSVDFDSLGIKLVR